MNTRPQINLRGTGLKLWSAQTVTYFQSSLKPDLKQWVVFETRKP